MKQSAKPSLRPREEHVRARPQIHTVCAVLLPCAALSEGHRGGLGIWGAGVEGGEGREKSVMRSTIKVQRKIRTHLFCFWKDFKR